MDKHYNANTTTTNIKRDLLGYRLVKFHPDRISNIFSLAKKKKEYPITYNSIGQNAFILKKNKGTNKSFIELWYKQYYLYVHQTNTKQVLVNIVAQN